jgi:hypothetical protein
MLFENHSLLELLGGLEAELAKGLSEIRHAQTDLEKAENRYKFSLAMIHYLKERYEDIK